MVRSDVGRQDSLRTEGYRLASVDCALPGKWLAKPSACDARARHQSGSMPTCSS